MRGLLHYYFDGVMPFLQVSLGSSTVCPLSPAANVFSPVPSREGWAVDVGLPHSLPSVSCCQCVSFHLCHLGGVGSRRWAWWERGGSPCSCHFVLDHLINSLGQGLLLQQGSRIILLSLLSNI